ncbi:cystatin-F-like isoform X1 [Salvelinus fontinalis]|uniref:cystatin-F-like isoform X1 n=1 Tax=Salvelinus fontinalis TaxID=8038 RepID=UPI0024854D61|nr:cystatin-F-like isoform X1 [Salvelinus fontinalis]
MGLSYMLLLFCGLCSIAFFPPVSCQRLVPGAPYKINTNDKGVLKAVLHGTYSFNNQTNDAFLFKPSAIEKANGQIVKGLKYILEVDLSRTVCCKNGHGDPDLANCKFQTDILLQQTFHCDFEVWTMPWLHFMKTTYFSCSPSDPPSTSP